MRFFFFIFPIFFLTTNFTLAQDIEEAIRNGNKAYLSGEFEKAENIFQSVLERDLKNYHVLKSLAETKIKLKKFGEAKSLVDRILEMPIVSGRNVLVFQQENIQPEEAELIDVSVMAIDESAKAEDLGSASKYVIQQTPESAPHYRVYLKKSRTD